MTSASPIDPKNATSATGFSVVRVSLMVLRWIATVPMVVYTLGGVIFGSIGLVSQGLTGLFNTPLGHCGHQLWPKLFDLFAVFFERKLTLGIAGYPVGGTSCGGGGCAQPLNKRRSLAWLCRYLGSGLGVDGIHLRSAPCLNPRPSTGLDAAGHPSGDDVSGRLRP